MPKEIRNGGQTFYEDDIVFVKNDFACEEMSIEEIPETDEFEVPNSFIVKCRLLQGDALEIEDFAIGSLRKIIR